MTQRKSTKGTKQIGAEVSAQLLDEFKKLCESRGETLRYHLEMAMRRHLANPPPRPEDVPLPPVTSPQPTVPDEEFAVEQDAPKRMSRAEIEVYQIITNIDRGLEVAALQRLADWIQSGDLSPTRGERDLWIQHAQKALLAVPKTRREKAWRSVLDWIEAKLGKGKKS